MYTAEVPRKSTTFWNSYWNEWEDMDKGQVCQTNNYGSKSYKHIWTHEQRRNEPVMQKICRSTSWILILVINFHNTNIQNYSHSIQLFKAWKNGEAFTKAHIGDGLAVCIHRVYCRLSFLVAPPDQQLLNSSVYCQVLPSPWDLTENQIPARPVLSLQQILLQY